MARIRTIKPDFFTSDDICALQPLARLLYQGLWCEADREGRFAWAPSAFKRRYLPDDDCDINVLCKELLGRDLVRLYGEGLAHIPTFLVHQRVNPRESKSELPEPPAEHAPARVTDASNLGQHAQVGRKEGKEGEGRDAASRRVQTAHELPDDWKPSEENLAEVRQGRPDLTPAMIDTETQRFRNHAKANNRTAHNWGPNWVNWMAKADAPKEPKAEAATIVADRDSDSQWKARMRPYRANGFWLEGEWGPRPESGKSRVPAPILAEWQARHAN